MKNVVSLFYGFIFKSHLIPGILAYNKLRRGSLGEVSEKRPNKTTFNKYTDALSSLSIISSVMKWLG